MSYTVRNAKRAMAHFSDTPKWQISRDTERGPVRADDWHKRYPLTMRVALTYAERNGRDFDFCNEYGEPGYVAPEKGVLFSNWNDWPKALVDRLEAQGYELEWSDEWVIDHDGGGKAYRTSPDSHGWQSSVQYTDGGMLTPDSDISEWVEWARCDTAADATRALPGRYADELAALGWERVSADYEHGFHPGQTDNPREIAGELLKTHSAVLFVIDETGQFDIHFSAYVPTEE